MTEPTAPEPAGGTVVADEAAYTYWAFISYSHADESWASWLHRSLETYKVPKPIVGTPGPGGGPLRPARLFPLFRDREELSTASSLGGRIQGALAASRNLIVICSPNAVGSRWVNEEIRTFKALGREGRVFCLIVDGEPNAGDRPGSGLSECFPEAVRYVVGTDGRISADRTEPLAADARSDKDGTRNALLKLAAGILDVGFDSLKQRDQERRMRQIAVAGVVLAAAVVVLAGLTYYAFVQKGAAEREARAARAALSGQVASHAQIALDRFPQRALLLAVQAVRITEDKHEPSVAAAREALRRALNDTGGRAFGPHDSPISAVELSPDGRWLIAAPQDGATARLWKLDATEGPIGRLELHGVGGPVAVSPDGRWLATAGRGSESARLWELTSRDPSSGARVLEAATGPLAFSPDNRWLVTGGADKSVRLWDLGATTPGPAPLVLPAQENDQIVVALSRDGRWLVTSSWNPQANRGATDVARLWDLSARDPATTGVELKGHTSSVSNVVFSPDGRWLATSSAESDTHTFRSDTRVLLWDLQSPTKSPLVLLGHDKPITAMAMSRDGRWLATGSEDRTARLWDLKAPATGAAIVLPDHQGPVVGVVIAPRSDQVVTIEGKRGWREASPGDPVARVWKLATPPKTTRPTVVTRDERPVIVSTFTSSDDGRRLLLASGGAAFVLDFERPDAVAALAVLRAHEDEITTVAFARDGRHVVTGSKDRTARLWRIQSVRQPANPIAIRAHLDERFVLSPDHRWLVTIGDDTAAERSNNIAVVWDLATESPAARPVFLRGHTGPISDAGFSPDGRWLATGSHDRTVRLWDLSAADPRAAPVVLSGHAGVVSRVVFTPDGRWMVTGSFDSTVRLWGLTGGRPNAEPTVLRVEGAVYRLAIGADSRWLAVRAGQRSSVWDLTAKNPAEASTFLKDADRHVLLSPDGRWLATHGSDEALSLERRAAVVSDPAERMAVAKRRASLVPVAALLDLRAKDFQSTRRLLDNAGEPLGVSPDGRWLITRGQENLPLLWPLAGQGASPAPIALREHTKPLNSAAFSVDSRWLVTGGYDGTARRWDLSAKDVGASSRLLSRHPISAEAVAISPDGRRLLSAGHDAAYLWEPRDDGSLPSPTALPVGKDHVGGATFGADGNWLVTRSHDSGTVSVWAMKLDTLIRLACRTAGRNLTVAEWEQYFPGHAYTKVCPGLELG